MLAFAFVGSRRPRSCCHLKVAECPFEKSRPEAQATSKKEVGIRNTLHNRYSAPRPAGGPPEVPRRPIQVGHRKLYSGFMQGCGYGMGVVAAVTRTFPVKPVCVCLHQLVRGGGGWADWRTDWGLGRVCSLLCTGGRGDKVCRACSLVRADVPDTSRDPNRARKRIRYSRARTTAHEKKISQYLVIDGHVARLARLRTPLSLGEGPLVYLT